VAEPSPARSLREWLDSLDEPDRLVFRFAADVMPVLLAGRGGERLQALATMAWQASTPDEALAAAHVIANEIEACCETVFAQAGIEGSASIALGDRTTDRAQTRHWGRPGESLRKCEIRGRRLVTHVRWRLMVARARGRSPGRRPCVRRQQRHVARATSGADPPGEEPPGEREARVEDRGRREVVA
jgi:hypothetical protein